MKKKLLLYLLGIFIVILILMVLNIEMEINIFSKIASLLSQIMLISSIYFMCNTILNELKYKRRREKFYVIKTTNQKYFYNNNKTYKIISKI